MLRISTCIVSIISTWGLPKLGMEFQLPVQMALRKLSLTKFIGMNCSPSLLFFLLLLQRFLWNCYSLETLIFEKFLPCEKSFWQKCMIWVCSPSQTSWVLQWHSSWDTLSRCTDKFTQKFVVHSLLDAYKFWKSNLQGRAKYRLSCSASHDSTFLGFSQKFSQIEVFICRQAIENEITRGSSREDAQNIALNTLLKKTTVFGPNELMKEGETSS